MDALIQILVYAWAGVGLLLVLVVVNETVPPLFKRLRHRTRFEHGFKPYFGAAADGYREETWPVLCFREFFESVRVEWAPYVAWRQRPFSGRYHTFDSEGRRRTWNAPAPTGGVEPIRIFMFGGSTIMGMGVRDEGTVPSCLSRRLARAGFRVDVTNYGQIGYVLAQEVVQLLELLKRGVVPDIALFSDGQNEVMTAEATGRAGRIWQEENRIREFNLTQPCRRGDLVRAGLRAMAPNTCGALGLFEPPRPVEPVLAEAEVVPLAEEVVRLYWENVRILDRLAADYGFLVRCFWQPALFGKRRPTPFEERFRDDRDTPMFRAVYRT